MNGVDERMAKWYERRIEKISNEITRIEYMRILLDKQYELKFRQFVKKAKKFQHVAFNEYTMDIFNNPFLNVYPILPVEWRRNVKQLYDINDEMLMFMCTCTIDEKRWRKKHYVAEIDKLTKWLEYINDTLLDGRIDKRVAKWMIENGVPVWVMLNYV